MPADTQTWLHHQKSCCQFSIMHRFLVTALLDQTGPAAGTSAQSQCRDRRGHCPAHGGRAAHHPGLGKVRYCGAGLHAPHCAKMGPAWASPACISRSLEACSVFEPPTPACLAGVCLAFVNFWGSALLMQAGVFGRQQCKRLPEQLQRCLWQRWAAQPSLWPRYTGCWQAIVD